MKAEVCMQTSTWRVPHQEVLMKYCIFSILLALALLALWWQISPARADLPGHPSSAAEGWVQRGSSGFGDPANSNISSLNVFGSYLYAGAWNNNGAQVWRSTDGQSWDAVTPAWSNANTEVNFATPFAADLYLGANNMAGGEVWRTNGAAWTRVISTGLGDTNNYGFSAAAVFNSNLYVASSNLPPDIGGSGNGVEIYRSANGNAGSWTQVNSDGFGRGPTWLDITMDVYQGNLYVGLGRYKAGFNSLAELWRSNNGLSWTPVFTDGLGSANNTYLTAMAEFQGNFYAGLRNTVTGAQVWRYDGSSWTPVFTDGLGKTQNNRPYGLIVYQDHLLVVLCNLGGGAEVWQTRDGATWQQIGFGGWGDGNNQYADYFDKAAAIFQQNLYIGTLNEPDGGEVWQRLHLIDLPTVLRN